MLMWIMSDRAIPRSFRIMEGFGVHTFRLVNAEGRSTFVKFHWKPKQGLHRWSGTRRSRSAAPIPTSTAATCGTPSARRLPRVGTGPAAVRRRLRRPFAFDVLDPTKIIPEEQVPVRRVGRMVLDRVVGQLLCRDRAGRVLHAEHRARHRLHQRPAAAGPEVLLPRHPAQAPGRPELHPPAGQRAQVPGRQLPAGRAYGDGQPARPGQLRAQLLGPARARARTRPPASDLPRRPGRQAGPKRRLRPESFADHYSQARQFYISQTEVEQRHIADAFTFELSKCDQEAIRDPDGGRAAQRRRGPGRGGGRRARPARDAGRRCPPPAKPSADLPASPALSILANGPESFAGRKSASWSPTASTPPARRTAVGGRAGEGHRRDRRAHGCRRRRQRRQRAGRPAARRGPVGALRRRRIIATRRAAALAALPAARDFVADAYAHCKFIGYTRRRALFEAAGRAPCSTMASSASTIITPPSSSPDAPAISGHARPIWRKGPTQPGPQPVRPGTRLSRREEAWKTAEILVLRHQLAVLHGSSHADRTLDWTDPPGGPGRARAPPSATPGASRLPGRPGLKRCERYHTRGWSPGSG